MRKYVIANTEDASSFDFDQLVDIDESYSRKSLDGTKILVRYESEKPPFLDSDLTEYTVDGISSILLDSEWYKKEE